MWKWLNLALILVFLPLLVSADPACEAVRADEIYGVNLVVTGQNWDDLSLGALNEALSRLPPHIVAGLNSRVTGRLNILCNAEGRTLSGHAVYPEGANFYYNSDGFNEVILYPDQGPLTVLHELGHAYQMRDVRPGKYASVLLNEEMRDFTQATGWKVLNTDEEVESAVDQTQLAFAYEGPDVWQFMSHEDPLEDYANSFAMFFYDPQRLAELSPVRYEWMNAHLGAGEAAEWGSDAGYWGDGAAWSTQPSPHKTGVAIEEAGAAIGGGAGRGG